MGNRLSLLLMTAVWLLLIAAALPLRNEALAAGKQVLIINSYHAGLSWTDSVMNGIRDTLNRSGLDIQSSAEYLDARRHVKGEAARLIRNTLIAKLRGSSPDVVIVSDNDALQFALKQRDILFSHSAIVFCGINNFAPSMIAGLTEITGVSEEVSVNETVDLALRLHPETREIIVIGRTSVIADKANRQSFAAALPGLPQRIRVTFWDDLPAPELRAKLGKVKSGSLLFVNGLMTDESGRQMMYGETTEWICRYCDFPVYSLWDTYLGYGIVGGKLVSGYQQGRIAAELALRILNGEKAEHIPVINASNANLYMFDYRQLTRFAIPLAKLPKGSRVVNRPDSFYEREKAFIWTTSLVLLTLSIILIVMALSIVRERRARELLRISEEKYRELVEHANSIILRMDPEGNVTFLNEFAQTFFGYREEEIIGKNVVGTIVPEKDSAGRDLRSLVSQIVNDRDLYAVNENENVRRDGERIWVTWTNRLLRDADGNPKEILSVGQDSSKRNLAEEALRESQRFLEAIFEQSPFPMWVSDDKGTLIRINQACRDLLRVTDEILVGKYNLFEDNIVAQQGAMPLVKRVFEEGERVGFTLHYDSSQLQTMQLRDTNKLVLDVTISPVLNARKQLINAVIQLRDITDRKRAEEALRESEEKFRVLAETSPTAIFLYQGEMIIYANPATERLFGYSSDELLRMRFWDWAHEDFREKVQLSGLARQRGEAAPGRYESRFVTKRGEDRWLVVSAGLIEYHGRQAGVASFLDITESKRVEAQLRDSLAEKELLLKEVHHRVKNNLQIISTLLDLQAEKIQDGNMQESIKESQDRIRAMALIHERLYQSSDLVRIDFWEYIESLVGQLLSSYVADPLRIAMKVDVGDIQLAIDRAIPCGLIINELVSNAMKHAFPDGRSGEIAIRLHADDRGQITLTVSDDGVGMPAGIDFRKTESLGLQLVNMLTRQLRGQIEMSGEHGTLWVISFRSMDNGKSGPA